MGSWVRVAGQGQRPLVVAVKRHLAGDQQSNEPDQGASRL
jgi:hypothetical protein